MKIVLCSDYFYPKIGGVTMHIENLAKSLNKRGHEVVVVTKKANFDDKVHGLNVVRIKSMFRSSQTLDIPCTEELEKILMDEKPDIVHAHHAFSPISLFSISISRRLGVKNVLTNHSIQFLYDFNYLWRPSSFLLFPFKQYIGMTNKVIAVSRAAATFISYFTDKEVEVIPNGVNVNDFTPNTKEFDGRSVLFVGRFVYRKGLHLLLEAMNKVIERNREAKLTIAGTGYLNSVLKFFVKASGLQDHVFIKESPSKDELIRLYQESNVFVLPSIFGESFGIVLLEAMASRTPIVATAQGGVGEIVKHMETGLVVRKDKIRGLAEGITKLLEDEVLSNRLSSKALSKVRKYDWGVIAKRMEEVYEEVLSS